MTAVLETGNSIKMIWTLSILAVIILPVIYIQMRNLDGNVASAGATFHPRDKTFTLQNDQAQKILSGDLAMLFNLDQPMLSCEASFAANAACGLWPGVARLEIIGYHDDGVECHTVEWQSLTNDGVPQDCFNVEGNHWYGGAETHEQHWPIELVTIAMQQYLSSDLLAMLREGAYGSVLQGAYGSVLERYWLASNGVAIHVHDDVPLHVSQSEEKLCFKADYTASWYVRQYQDERPRLTYTICSAPDIKAVHLYMAKLVWNKPKDIPDVNLFKNPIWSTWARFKTTVDQAKVEMFANEIVDNGLTGCQIEIDDKYTATYGDHVFDPAKFPDPKSMTGKLHALGFNVASWVTPFANVESAAFTEGMFKGYWVKDGKGLTPGLLKWWNGIGALLDFTNEDAVSWFFQRLENLRLAGIDSFKFDAGEVAYMPHGFTMSSLLANPGHFTRMYARAAYQHTNGLMEVRAAYQSQNLPVLVRIMDKESCWGYNMGLRSLIPNVLQLGIEGYPFILPDMVGGNAYIDAGSVTDDGALPEKGLYIRWLQTSLFFPVIQFSIAPWQYDPETVQMSRKLLEFRSTYIVPKLIHLAEESVRTGYPIIRPMWWVDPSNPTTWDIDTQFLLGDDIMVAPVVEEGANTRNIYLPNGNWKDGNSGTVHEGDQYIMGYQCPLECVPYFERVTS